jgi:hypothetical protein
MLKTRSDEMQDISLRYISYIVKLVRIPVRIDKLVQGGGEGETRNLDAWPSADQIQSHVHVTGLLRVS